MEKDEQLFASLIYLFHSTGMQGLGKVMNPMTNAIEKNIEQAQQAIDMLEMLKNKTKGNISVDAEKLLIQFLSDLRLNYVDEIAKNKKEMENNQTPQKDTKKIYTLLVVIALLIATNVFLWLQKNKSETKYEQTTDEKSKLQTELDQLEVDLNTATANADTLNQNLIAKDEELKGKVAELQAALKRGQMNKAQLVKAKNEIDQLRYYINKYQEQIADLKKENEELTNENTGLKQTVESEQKKSSDLLNKNISLSNKVAVAEILKPTSLVATGIKFRSNGKESETDRVKSLEKIKISFTLADNQVASTGNKDFFVRVINPENKAEVVTDANESKFNANGETLQYSVKRNFDFQNNPSQEYNIYWTKSSSLNPGDYTIVLYADGTSIGKTILKLK